MKSVDESRRVLRTMDPDEARRWAAAELRLAYDRGYSKGLSTFVAQQQQREWTNEIALRVRCDFSDIDRIGEIASFIEAQTRSNDKVRYMVLRNPDLDG